ncbi:hypothetical protein PENSPDRAFT_760058 [Peniophora sp. CONT]|nr:hypothetical protein PENSPDRAFT_760058 [Peniophora sp. CONT]
MSSLTETSTVLGKRKTRNSKSLVLHLSATDESDKEDSDFALGDELSEAPQHEEEGDFSDAPQPRHTKKRTMSTGTAIEKRYVCDFEGCDKSNAKAARLAEHARSHTGERPFACTTCNKSYLRETHLQAHARSHLPASARPFKCDASGCDKRFWTTQHLEVHEKTIHQGARPFPCTEPDCSESFAKHHQLRAHVASAHSPPGTKPYRCAHEDCGKSFATNQKLKAHAKVHDESRYACTLTPCDNVNFSTWTALQAHLRTEHPPTCPYSSCNGKTFARRDGLRAHLKIHRQREEEEAMGEDGDDEGEEDGEEDGEERPKKRRRGGELGRDWVCEEEGCGKDFKSKKALTTHAHVVHAGARDFVCAARGCAKAYGYKHLLQRHAARAHAQRSASAEGDEATAEGEEGEGSEKDNDDYVSTARNADPVPSSSKAKISGAKGKAPASSSTKNAHAGDLIDEITGAAYARAARATRTLPCPYPSFTDIPHKVINANVTDVEMTDADERDAIDAGGSSSVPKTCEYTFSRAYDLRRHVRAVHGVELAKADVDAWARKMRA